MGRGGKTRGKRGKKRSTASSVEGGSNRQLAAAAASDNAKNKRQHCEGGVEGDSGSVASVDINGSDLSTAAVAGDLLGASRGDDSASDYSISSNGDQRDDVTSSIAAPAADAKPACLDNHGLDQRGDSGRKKRKSELCEERETPFLYVNDDPELLDLVRAMSIKKDITKDYQYFCPGCNIPFIKLKKCVGHLKKCIPGDTFTCNICGGVGEKSEWKRHIRVCRRYYPGRISAAESALLRKHLGKDTIKRVQAFLIVNLGNRKSRARPSTSADGQEAIVKKVMLTSAKADRRHNGNCLFSVDPSNLFRLRCLGGCEKTVADMSCGVNRGEYLWCRRRTKKTLGLLSVSAMLQPASFREVDITARYRGISSNTSALHLTFVEGLRCPKEAEEHREWYERTSTFLRDLRLALLADPSITVTKLHAVPRSSVEGTVLVVADVSLSDIANTVTESFLSNKGYFALPQFPLHVAIGACDERHHEETLSKIADDLIGLRLSVNADKMSVLAPSLEEKFVSSELPSHEAAHWLDGNRDQYGHIIENATKVADRLNRRLVMSAGANVSSSNSNSGEKRKNGNHRNESGGNHPDQKQQSAEDDCPELDEDSVACLESLAIEAKEQVSKIAALVARIESMDRELQEKGLV